MTAFQLVRLVLNEKQQIVARVPLQPLFDLREDAMAMAEFGAARSNGEFRYDSERDCWCATDANGRAFRFVVEAIEVDPVKSAPHMAA
jgi:hypothetical protein